MDNANSAGGLNLGNISLPSILLVLASPVIIWLGLMMYLFVIAAYILTASIVPLAFSITSIYLVAPLSGSGFPAIPVHRPARPCVHIFVDDPQDAAIRSWKRTKRTRIHTRILLTRTDNRTRTHIHGSTTLLA